MKRIDNMILMMVTAVLMVAAVTFGQDFTVNGNLTVKGNVAAMNGSIPGYVVDIEGNTYKTVKIGLQEWTVENLRTTKYSDGTNIPLVTDSSAWYYRSTPAYCWYNNDISNRETYGALYNWYVVNPSNPKAIAPQGWRVPTWNDWVQLIDYLIANRFNYDFTTSFDRIAKSMAAQSHWNTETLVAGAVGNDLIRNNTSGFSGLPGGRRNCDGTFFDMGFCGTWWSSGSDGIYLKYSFSSSSSYTYNKSIGFSVRLVRDLN